VSVTFPHQLFISNEFVDASDGGTYETICPYDEQVQIPDAGSGFSHLILKTHFFSLTGAIPPN